MRRINFTFCLIFCICLFLSGCADSSQSSLGTSDISIDSSQPDSSDSTPSASEEIIYHESASPSSPSSPSSVPSDVRTDDNSPDLIWSNILNSQYTTQTPISGLSWTQVFHQYQIPLDIPESNNPQKMICEYTLSFQSQAEILAIIDSIKESGRIVPFLKESGYYYSISDSGLYFTEFFYGDGAFNVITNGDNSEMESKKELTLNDSRKSLIEQSGLDLSRTFVYRVALNEIGYGYIFSDGEKDFYLCTNITKDETVKLNDFYSYNDILERLDKVKDLYM